MRPDRWLRAVLIGSRPMPRILLANEFGAGRGHLVTLTQVGLALGPGFQFDAAICRREHAQELAPLRPDVFSGPGLVYRKERRVGPDRVPTATWGEYLGDLGFDRVERLRDVVGWWREVFTSRRVDLVVGEYAPLALLAARTLGIPTLSAGQGYGLPPSDMPRFPLLDPAFTVCLHDENRLLANVNTVATECGLAPLGGLPEVYHATLPLVQTLPLLDPYREHRRSAYLPPVTDIGAVADQPGDEVFVYFSTREFECPAVVEALERLPLPRRGYLPAVPADVARRLAASGMVLEPSPVPVDEIARRSRLILNAGQHGILCLALYAGLPQVALPQHMEQLFHARRAEAADCVRVVTGQDWETDRLIEVVRTAYDDAGLQARARRVAEQLRAGLAGLHGQQVAQAVAPLREALLAGRAVLA